ncbi:hypothetical protein PILCRDRAFT_810923 [Piloderma croceum F 1598]|uniref:Uncharacterized protein n=1 Tax=Piloderma croceum (strain F 1598) TaxID=765440 RepID=A0A0C3CPQ6_PILCF|nr:hypothetical protein PILCRDRAFT_810923 [Piloderma croceum F 1598]
MYATRPPQAQISSNHVPILATILKHRYIALRFLPQISYERAAPLDISPQPSIITRIFMLIKGVPEDRLVDWSGAQRRAVENVDFWRNVVDVAKARDAKLFVVLEWDGMDVLRG